MAVYATHTIALNGRVKTIKYEDFQDGVDTVSVSWRDISVSYTHLDVYKRQLTSQPTIVKTAGSIHYIKAHTFYGCKVRVRACLPVSVCHVPNTCCRPKY